MEFIGDESIQKFGMLQARKYHLELERRFDLLGEFPGIGIASDDLRPGLFRQPHVAHTIFYTIHPDHILIVRVLPARADFGRHF